MSVRTLNRKRAINRRSVKAWLGVRNPARLRKLNSGCWVGKKRHIYASSGDSGELTVSDTNGVAPNFCMRYDRSRSGRKVAVFKREGVKLSICEPALQAVPETFRVTGQVQTSQRVGREEVFDVIESPPSRVARLSAGSNVLEDWRGAAMIGQGFKGTRLGWPLDVTLRPGVYLDAASGVPTWRAEQAVDGLLEGEPYFVEAVTGLLAQAKGIVISLPGAMRALIIRESYFVAGAVEVGEPFYYSELDMAEALDTDVPPAGLVADEDGTVGSARDE